MSSTVMNCCWRSFSPCVRAASCISEAANCSDLSSSPLMIDVSLVSKSRRSSVFLSGLGWWRSGHQPLLSNGWYPLRFYAILGWFGIVVQPYRRRVLLNTAFVEVYGPSFWRIKNEKYLSGNISLTYFTRHRTWIKYFDNNITVNI